jgi:hypothetical protein
VRFRAIASRENINQDFASRRDSSRAIALPSVKQRFAIARSFYYPRPGLQSAKPSASVSRKLAIASSILLRLDIRFQQHEQLKLSEFVQAKALK